MPVNISPFRLLLDLGLCPPVGGTKTIFIGLTLEALPPRIWLLQASSIQVSHAEFPPLGFLPSGTALGPGLFGLALITSCLHEVPGLDGVM